MASIHLPSTSTARSVRVNWTGSGVVDNAQPIQHTTPTSLCNNSTLSYFLPTRYSSTSHLQAVLCSLYSLSSGFIVYSNRPPSATHPSTPTAAMSTTTTNNTGQGKLVAVTGASGFVAGGLVDLLIKRGYTVRGTVRNLHDNNKTSHLKQDFPTLQLYEADLLKPGSFDECFQGCEIVFHTASPFQTKVNDPQKDLVEPAVHGTENVIEAALKVPSVKRIVLTSSVATVRRPEKEKEGWYVSNDKDWNNFANIDNLPYPYSKVAAEKRAWDLVTQWNSGHPEQQVKLVTIHPSWVMGPPAGNRVDGVSVGTIVSWLDESQVDSGVRPQAVGCVDIREVATAHVEAAEREDANGRYIVSHTNSTPPLDMIEIFKKKFPNKRFPDKVNGTLNPPYGVDNSRTQKELGVVFRPLEETLFDMADKLVQLGLVKP